MAVAVSFHWLIQPLQAVQLQGLHINGAIAFIDLDNDGTLDFPLANGDASDELSIPAQIASFIHLKQQTQLLLLL